MAKKTLLQQFLFNKYAIVIGFLLIIYLTGGQNFIFDNPTIFVFGGIVFLVMVVFGGKK